MQHPRRLLGPGMSLGLVAGLFFLAAGCGLDAQQGDCGPYLSSAECHVVRAQLGALPDRPPPDLTNRFGRCQVPGSPDCEREDLAVEFGRRIFFDKCLSADRTVGCVTCHEPRAAFTDPRERPIVRRLLDGTTMPLIKSTSPTDVRTPPPMMEALRDATGAALARWDAAEGVWVPEKRRPQSSYGPVIGTTLGTTPRHSPMLYNLAYAAGTPPEDGGRTFGVTWTPWDGRYDSAWALVTDVLENAGTQGSNRSYIAQRIYSNPQHRQAYERMMSNVSMPPLDRRDMNSMFVYPSVGSPGAADTTPGGCWWSPKFQNCGPNELVPSPEVRRDINDIFVNTGKALSAYMRRLRSARSPYDRWLAGEVEALSPSAQRGLRLFIGKAQCIMCHSGPNFTDWRFHNLGVPSDDPDLRTAGSVRLSKPAADRLDCADGMGPNGNCADQGRGAWQLRANSQCVFDSQTFVKAGPPRSASDMTPSDITLTCQRVDFLPSQKRSDVNMDCNSEAADIEPILIEDPVTKMMRPEDSKESRRRVCIPGTTLSHAYCAHVDQASCSQDPACEWVSPTMPEAMSRVMVVTSKERCVAKLPRVNNVNPELGAFKTPSLRNIAKTWPYMHNGALADYGPAQRGETTADDPLPHLLRVIEFYNQGGGRPEVGLLDAQIRPLHLSRPEMMDLAAFLMALTDESLHELGDPLATPPMDLDDKLGPQNCAIPGR